MNLSRMRDRIRLWGKEILFPGLDLHTRCRYRFLSRYFRKGAIDTLDAGCGNGALSYAAYRRGNRVLGVTMEPGQVKKDNEYFSFLGTILIVNSRSAIFTICLRSNRHLIKSSARKHWNTLQVTNELFNTFTICFAKKGCCTSVARTRSIPVIRGEFVPMNRWDGTSAMDTL